MTPLVTAGVSDDVAQDVQMLIGPHPLEGVEEPMLSRPATLKDPGTPDQIVLDQNSLTHLPSAKCASNPEDATSRTGKNRRSGASTSV